LLINRGRTDGVGVSVRVGVGVGGGAVAVGGTAVGGTAVGGATVGGMAVGGMGGDCTGTAVGVAPARGGVAVGDGEGVAEKSGGMVRVSGRVVISGSGVRREAALTGVVVPSAMSVTVPVTVIPAAIVAVGRRSVAGGRLCSSTSRTIRIRPSSKKIMAPIRCGVNRTPAITALAGLYGLTWAG
jgi:hypothetical protein